MQIVKYRHCSRAEALKSDQENLKATDRQTDGCTDNGGTDRQAKQTDLMCNWKGRSAAGVPAAPVTNGTMCALPTPSAYTRTMHST